MGNTLDPKTPPSGRTGPWESSSPVPPPPRSWRAGGLRCSAGPSAAPPPKCPCAYGRLSFPILPNFICSKANLGDLGSPNLAKILLEDAHLLINSIPEGPGWTRKRLQKLASQPARRLSSKQLASHATTNPKAPELHLPSDENS